VATREAILKEVGLDQPLSAQFVHYLNDISPISIHENSLENQEKYGFIALFGINGKVLALKFPYLRRSFQSNKKVSEILLDHFPGTLWLALVAMVFATVFGMLFGVWAALRPNTWIDHTLIIGSVLGISIPSFVAAIGMALLFAYYLAPFTGLNLTGSLWVLDPFHGYRLELKNLILPAITLGIRPLAIITQLMRSAMLDVLSQDYIRTAKAKGLPFRVVVLKHALKNALNPVITAVSGWLASLLAGAFFVEYIFNWKGLGSVSIRAVENLDFPVVMGCTLFISTLFVLINTFVDFLYAAVDPRIRLK
ncbi:MAG: ABC transporter permease, partial [Cytophagales bacterium]|nr:ABC transporter permease [Cytophagales bacterium]